MVGIGNRAESPSNEAQVHLFVDLSNIVRGAQAAAKELGDWPYKVRLHAANFQQLLLRGRTPGTQLVVANAEVPKSVRDHFMRVGFTVEVRELGNRTGTEQANDEALLTRLYETITDPMARGRRLVLTTGDGNGWKLNRGFSVALERASSFGWGVELYSWVDNLNPHLRDVVIAEGGTVHLLDADYFGITFVEGQRRAQPIPRWWRSIHPATASAPGSQHACA